MNATAGTCVTCEDLDTGETESRVIHDDYAVIVDGDMELAHISTYSSGTVQITLRRAPSSEGTDG